MIRVLSDFPIQKKKCCYYFSFFCKPEPVSRVDAEQEEMLTSHRIIEKIKLLKTVAKERLINNSKRREQTNSFYLVIQSIDTNRLQDLKTVNDYVSIIENLNGINSVLNFEMGEEEVPNENIRHRPLSPL